MTPQTLAAIRILALVAAYRERFGARAATQLLKQCASGWHKATDPLQCAVAGCDQRAFGLNLYCPMHRRRFQRHGDPEALHQRGRKRRG